MYFLFKNVNNFIYNFIVFLYLISIIKFNLFTIILFYFIYNIYIYTHTTLINFILYINFILETNIYDAAYETKTNIALLASDFSSIQNTKVQVLVPYFGIIIFLIVEANPTSEIGSKMKLYLRRILP